MTDAVRADGFYWVRLDFRPYWTPAELFDGEYWWVTGEEIPLLTDRIIEIGPMITPPGDV